MASSSITFGIAIVCCLTLDSYGRVLVLLAGFYLGLSTFWDVRERRIPNKLNLGYALTMLVACFISSLLSDPSDLGNFNRALLSGLVVFLFFLALHIVSHVPSLGGSGLGMGDVKLAFGIGMSLGWFSVEAVIWGLMAAFALAGITALAVLCFSSEKTLPFAPILGAGTLTGLTLILN